MTLANPYDLEFNAVNLHETLPDNYWLNLVMLQTISLVLQYIINVVEEVRSGFRINS